MNFWKIYGYILITIIISCNNDPSIKPQPDRVVKTDNAEVDDIDDNPRVDNTTNDEQIENPRFDEKSSFDEKLSFDCLMDEIPGSETSAAEGHANLFLVNGIPTSICTLLTESQKDTAIFQFIPSLCNDCEQSIQNTWWAIERSGYKNKFLHVLAISTGNDALLTKIRKFIQASAIPAILVTDTQTKLENELLRLVTDLSQPSFYTINSLLQVDYVSGNSNLYLDIVPKAESILLSVDASEEEQPGRPFTDWSGLDVKASGNVDIHSVTDIFAVGDADGF